MGQFATTCSPLPTQGNSTAKGCLRFAGAPCPKRSTGSGGRSSWNPRTRGAWYFQGIVELSLDDTAAATFSIDQVARLVSRGRANRDDLSRAVEIVQGPIRERAEGLLEMAPLRIRSARAER